MTGNTFLPRLFLFQIAELGGCIFFLLHDLLWLAAGCLGLLLIFTMIVHSSFQPDPKTDLNGEIMTIQQNYTNRAVAILWRIKMGTATWDDYKKVKAEEAEFEKTIEIDPHDHRTLLRWKK